MSTAIEITTGASIRRERLLDAAERAVIREGTDVSMAAIAAEAGITKPIIYRVFGDKSSLYQALADRHTERLLTALRVALGSTTDRRARTRAVINAFLTVIGEQPEIYQFLVHRAATDDPEVRRTVRSFIHRLGVELGQGIAYDTGTHADDPATQIWGVAMVGAVQLAAERWLDEPMGMTRAELTEALTDLFFGAYATSPQPHPRSTT